MEDVKKSKDDSKLLWKLLSPHRPSNKSFVYLALLVLVATSLELVIPLYSSYLVDSISQDGIEVSIIVGLVSIALLAAIFETTLGWYGGKLGHGITLRLRYSLIGRLLNGQSVGLDSEHSAELSARVVNDTKEVKTVLAEDLIGLLSGVISLLAVLIIMLVLDWRLTLVLVSSVVIGFVLITPIALMMNQVGKATLGAEASLLKHVTEWLRYGHLIKSHNAGEHLHKQSKDLLQTCLHHEMKGTKVISLIGPISNLVLMVSMIAILSFSAYWLKHGSITLGTITAFLLYLFGLAFPLMSMAMFFSSLNKAIGSASRLSEISRIPQESTTGYLLEGIAQLSVKNLNFIRDGKHILNDVSYQFSAKGLSVVLGESGSGKSTLLNQFLGFYPETHTHVLINGKTLNHYDLKSVRRGIAWVDQEPKLLHASIRQNLTLGLDEKISDDKLFELLKSVGLESWLASIDYDLERIVSEQNNQFSGGEKQRFAIARAILRRSKVLLLDEPTSALDSKNKDELMSLLRSLSTSIKIIMITHHRELIQPSDDVLELADGNLVKRDTFKRQLE
ncbi:MULTISPECIES: ABC transporter ATP-binding protein [Pseudoalteromonas]|uniref:ABC transporter ATP-binding protein n=1 Tax=Pseudoalteromonas amylolytica TaxID=1859457 RepID=A0A1S1MNX7_9GAMM|nr:MULTISPECIES: ABC transporter ATP-binding protein [Pseudoalteromonas]OHU85796.1 hypothetical protein BFC16_18020 [Pseudoalteromonas sp. JW3]OHU87302.1 hypothetical protein BET10_20375 [Pseudoalteromonas amylolytica]